MTTHEPTLHTLDDALDAYQRVYMPSRNFAPKTRSGYTDDLRDLLRFLDGQGRTQSVDVVHADLEAFLAHLDRRVSMMLR